MKSNIQFTAKPISLPLKGNAELTDIARDWCESVIVLAQDKLDGQIRLTQWSFRESYAADDLAFEHLQVDIQGEDVVPMISLLFVASGVSFYDYPTKHDRPLCTLSCFVTDMAEAIYITGILQEHLNARLHTLNYRTDLNPVRLPVQ